jgi:spermidine synthase
LKRSAKGTSEQSTIVTQAVSTKIPALVAVLIAALLSGAASLAYEVVWSRMLVVPLGNSADATAMVLAAFMLGIAFGAQLLGRIADRVRSPLRLYAILEIVLGVYAFIAPMLIDGLDGADGLRGSLAERPMAAVGRLVAAGALVVLPSLVMGATIPVLVRALSRSASDIRHRIGLIYGTNTLGAAVGAAFTGFIAIPFLGFTLTSGLAALANFSAAGIALATGRFLGEGRTKDDREPARGEIDEPPSRARAAAALIAATVAGLSMLSAEVLWSRVLTFVFGHDTYAFATLLAIVLTGLGIGGLVHRRLASLDPLKVCGVLTGLLALALVASYWIAAALVTTYGRDPFDLGSVGALATSLKLEFYREILYTPVLVLVPSIISGMLFPAACALYSGPVEQAGSRVGTATLVNGVGCAVGSLITSFGLIAWIGIQGALLAAALIAVSASLLIAGIGALATRSRRGVVLAIPAALAVGIAALLPPSLTRAMLKEAVGVRHQSLLYYEEGRTGTVSVTRNTINSEKQLFMNAVNEVTTRLVHDQSFKLLGHLGPLLHPNPQNGAMVCLGAGLSAGAALVHPLASLDVVELSSSIPRAAALWKDENNNVLDNPRFSLHIEDGRHYLLSTDKRFDVIMVDSTHPKAVDSWILYTEEFYELVKSRLKDDGIAVQWVPLHGFSETEFKIIARTFYKVFPHATLWVNVGFEVYGQAAYIKMVATKSPLSIDYKELDLRLKEPKIHDDLAPFGMAAPEEILDAYLAGPRAIDAWTKGVPVQTDDRPLLPYTTEYSKGRRMAAPLLLGVRSSVLLVLRNMGKEEAAIRERLKQAEEAQGFLLAGYLDRAAEIWPEGQKIKLFRERSQKGRDYYLALAEKYADEPGKLFEIASLIGNLGYPEDARALFQKAYDADPSDTRYGVNLALTSLDLGDTAKALDLLKKAVSMEPENGLAHYNLGVAYNAGGDAKSAIRHLEEAIDLIPDLVGAHLALADAHLALGHLDQAEAFLLQLTEENGFVAEAWDMLGLVAARRKDWERAKTYHVRALSLEPYRAASHYNLGIVLEEQGHIKDAARAYQAALEIEPKDAEAHNNLGLLYARVGLFDLAVKSYLDALDFEPHYPEAAYNLGLAYRAQHQLLPAAEAFGLALKLNPDLEPAKKQLEELHLKVDIEVDGGVPDGGLGDVGPRR